MEQNQEQMQQIQEMLDSQAQNPVQVSEEKKELTADQKRKLTLKQKKQQAEMNKYIARVTKQYRSVQNKLNNEIQSLKKQIGVADFAMLKDICTVNKPEQLNDKGEVIQKATTYVNKQALVVEARNLIILKRQERVKNGLRKKSTGRGSKRSYQRSAVKYLNNRNKEQSTPNA